MTQASTPLVMDGVTIPLGRPSPVEVTQQPANVLSQTRAYTLTGAFKAPIRTSYTGNLGGKAVFTHDEQGFRNEVHLSPERLSIEGDVITYNQPEGTA